MIIIITTIIITLYLNIAFKITFLVLNWFLHNPKIKIIIHPYSRKISHINDNFLFYLTSNLITVPIRNVRNEINAAELHAVFLPFGNITFCNFIGQETLLTVLTGAVTVRSILIEYKNPVNAAECFSSMNGFNLGGVHLIVETVDQSMAAALKGAYFKIFHVLYFTYSLQTDTDIEDENIFSTNKIFLFSLS